MLKCSWCEQTFESVDHLIPVPDSSSHSGRTLYTTKDRHVAHNLYEVTQAELDAEKSAGSFNSLMALLDEPTKEPEPAENDAPVYQ
jgi:hypothetical protein